MHMSFPKHCSTSQHLLWHWRLQSSLSVHHCYKSKGSYLPDITVYSRWPKSTNVGNLNILSKKKACESHTKWINLQKVHWTEKCTWSILDHCLYSISLFSMWNCSLIQPLILRQLQQKSAGTTCMAEVGAENKRN